MTIRTALKSYSDDLINHSNLIPLICYTCILQYHEQAIENSSFNSPVRILIIANRVDLEFKEMQKIVNDDVFARLPDQTIDILYAIKKHQNMYYDLG